MTTMNKLVLTQEAENIRAAVAMILLPQRPKPSALADARKLVRRLERIEALLKEVA